MPCNMVYKNLRFSNKTWDINFRKLIFIQSMRNEIYHSSIKESPLITGVVKKKNSIQSTAH